ncbi:6-phospho-3-hexuloisomerase [Desemzia sp. RIT804]|nr:6-phospho-3-hexuloisomerase [Desemzia sp. RIT 804]
MDFLLPIVDEVRGVLEKVDRQEVESAAKLIQKETRIFVDGEGRSGFVGKCFAMRLMHLGFEVYVMGESTTPSFNAGDIFVCVSGSGNTGSVLLNAKKAKKLEGKVITITNNRHSSLGEISDQVIKLDATVRGDTENRTSIQLLGSLFDQSVHLLLDNICLILSKRDHITNEAATQNHV